MEKVQAFNKDRIKALRLAFNLTQEDFAAKCGGSIKKQHVSNWENGRVIPDTSSLLVIANTFRLSMDYFFVDK